MSEIMPNRQRAKAVSLFLSINWGCNLAVGLLTLTAINTLGGVKASMTDDESADAQKIGVSYVYFIFAGITFCCLAFLHFFVPETKGVYIYTDDIVLNECHFWTIVLNYYVVEFYVVCE